MEMTAYKRAACQPPCHHTFLLLLLFSSVFFFFLFWFPFGIVCSSIFSRFPLVFFLEARETEFLERLISEGFEKPREGAV